MLNKSDSIISQGTNIIPASEETKHTKHDKLADIDTACSCLLKNNPSYSIIENQQNNHMISDNNKRKQIYMNHENKRHSANIAKELQTENTIIKSTKTVQDKAKSKVQMTNHGMIISKSLKDQTIAIEGNENRIKEMIDEKSIISPTISNHLKKAIQVTSNTPNMGLQSMNQYKKSDKINDSDKEYNIKPYQTDTKDTIHTSTNICTSKLNEECD